MAGHRFYLPASEWPQDLLVLTLDAEESHHCVDVLRLGVGAQVSVFDGMGRVAKAEVAVASRKATSLRVCEIILSTEAGANLQLAQAIPKGKSMDLIIEKAVELGTREIYPLVTERTVVRLDAAEASKKQEKWQRVAIEACKQCGQNWLPKVHVPQSLAKFLSARLPADVLLVAALDAAARPLRTLWPEHAQSACVLVGPEGDFSPLELSLILAAGFEAWTLGPIILRAETAALFALSVLGHELRMTRVGHV